MMGVRVPALPFSQWLRQKGMMGADKKAGRVAAEGAVAAYIHPGSRLGACASRCACLHTGLCDVLRCS